MPNQLYSIFLFLAIRRLLLLCCLKEEMCSRQEECYVVVVQRRRRMIKAWPDHHDQEEMYVCGRHNSNIIIPQCSAKKRECAYSAEEEIIITNRTKRLCSCTQGNVLCAAAGQHIRTSSRTAFWWSFDHKTTRTWSNASFVTGWLQLNPSSCAPASS